MRFVIIKVSVTRLRAANSDYTQLARRALHFLLSAHQIVEENGIKCSDSITDSVN